MSGASDAVAVLYVQDLPGVHEFYRAVLGLTVLHVGEDHVDLQTRAGVLTLVAIPAHVAAGIEIADPPQRRTENPVKLVFPVPAIDGARAAAGRLGGALDPVEQEWLWQDFRACDGHDPEGNVFQVREPAAG